MKKTYQALKAILMSVAVAFMASCVDEFEYQPATDSNGKPATETGFITSNLSVLDLENNEPQTFEITVERPDDSAPGTIKLVSDNAKFKVPQAVEFKAGEKSKKVTISFDMQPASTEKVNIKVADDQAYTYANTELNLTVNRYILHHANWDSWYYGWMFENISIMEFPKGTYTIKGLHAKADWIDSDLGTITFRKTEDGLLHMNPQYIHKQKWNNDGLKDYWIVGFWYGDSEQLWKKEDIKNLKHDECGKYHPEDDTFELWFHWYSPDFGWWTNNQKPEWIALLD